MVGKLPVFEKHRVYFPLLGFGSEVAPMDQNPYFPGGWVFHNSDDFGGQAIMLVEGSVFGSLDGVVVLEVNYRPVEPRAFIPVVGMTPKGDPLA